MAAKFNHAIAVLTLFGFTAVSYAGIERFWTLSKNDNGEEQFNECENLTKEQQHQLIQTYQTIRNEKEKLDLKKRMDWFCQLTDEQQQRMRIAWQNMNSTERNILKQKLQTAKDSSERTQIRNEILEKYNNDE